MRIRQEEKVDLGIRGESKTCPWCGRNMHYIEEPHTELDRVAYEPAYWECFHCGCTISDDRVVGYNIYADMYWDDEDEL